MYLTFLSGTILPQGGCSYRIQYNLITRLLPACDQLTTCIQPCDHIVHGPYKVKNNLVTRLLPACDGFTTCTQPCDLIVTRLLQGCDNLYQVVTRLLQPCDFCMGTVTCLSHWQNMNTIE